MSIFSFEKNAASKIIYLISNEKQTHPCLSNHNKKEILFKQVNTYFQSYI